MNTLRCGCLGLVAWATVAGGLAGVPEPDVVFYGTVKKNPTTFPYFPTEVGWTIAGNSETLTTLSNTIVVVNNQTFYVSRVAFETRRLADNTTLPATPNTLALTPAETTYSRIATVDGRRATLDGAGSFNMGVAHLGLVERVDLGVGGDSFAEWSHRIFGVIANAAADADGDGLSNYDEYLAGTDPKNPQSGLFVKNFTPATGGGFTFSWDALSTRNYSVERSADLRTWMVVFPLQPGIDGVMTFTDTNVTGAPRMFYRVIGTPR